MNCLRKPLTGQSVRIPVTLAVLVALLWVSPAAAQQPGSPAPAQPTPVQAAPDVGAADTEPGFDDESVVLNFEGADIREVIYSLATALDINYWLDPRVQGQVTVRTSSPIARDDLFPVFHHILRNNGYVAVNDGEMYVITQAEDGKTRVAVPGRTPEDLRREDHFVMELVKVKHVSAQELATLIETFVSPGGDVIAYPRSNLVIVSDLASNAARLVELVSTFDTDAFGDLSAKVYRIEHASIEEISEELVAILDSYQLINTDSGLYVIPLVRLDSIAVISFDPDVFANVEHWLKTLDVPAESGSLRQVHVYAVENTKAVDLADILNEVFADQGARVGTGGRGTSGAAAEAGLGLGGGLGSSRSRDGGGSGGLGSARGQDRGTQSRSGRQGRSTRSTTGGLASRSRAGGGALVGTPGSLFEQEVSIVADEITNTLVILATPRDRAVVLEVIRQLDIVPRQVLVEVLLAEITLSNDREFGSEQALNSADPSVAAATGDTGGTFFDLFGEEIRLTGSAGGTTGGIIGTFTHFRDGKAVYEAVLTALATQSRVKLLSRPHILTADNQEASILIGNEVPIITQQTDSDVQTEGSTRILQNVQYRDTGIIVRVLPQVNSEGLVNMRIAQEVSEIGDDTVQIEGITSPTFTTRETETTVVVQSGETIVIGGIIQENKRSSRAGVPYLMDIPVFGQLFRRDDENLRRTELIALITPYVVRDREEAKSVTEEFKGRVEHVLRELEAQEEESGIHHTVILD